MQYSKQQILNIVNTQLLLWIKKDLAVKEAVFELIEMKYPTKKEMDEKFEKMLKTFSQEQANYRETQEKKWETQEKKWEAQEKKWEAQDKKWEEWKIDDRKKWEEWITEDKKKWNENKIVNEKMFERFAQHDKIFEKILTDIETLNRKYTLNLSAIGTRWGTSAESSFREGLKSILETDFPVKVINYNKMDNECMVYKRPIPVEIDVIIHNGKTILCEISASFSSDEVDAFAKKIDFYEMKEKVKVSRTMIISPMMTPRALEEAKHYGIEVFTYPEKKMF